MLLERPNVEPLVVRTPAPLFKACKGVCEPPSKMTPLEMPKPLIMPPVAAIFSPSSLDSIERDEIEKVPLPVVESTTVSPV